MLESYTLERFVNGIHGINFVPDIGRFLSNSVAVVMDQKMQEEVYFAPETWKRISLSFGNVNRLLRIMLFLYGMESTIS